MDWAPHKKDWITKNLTCEEEIIGVYGQANTDTVFRSLGFVLWKR